MKAQARPISIHLYYLFAVRPFHPVAHPTIGSGTAGDGVGPEDAYEGTMEAFRRGSWSADTPTHQGGPPQIRGQVRGRRKNEGLISRPKRVSEPAMLRASR